MTSSYRRVLLVTFATAALFGLSVAGAGGAFAAGIQATAIHAGYARYFTPPSQVMTEIGVASEPVPAVVGMSASGRRCPSAIFTPQILSSSSPEPKR